VITRRSLLKSGASSASILATSSLGLPNLAKAAPTQLVIADAGGAVRQANQKAYYDTFTAKTGIKIVPVDYIDLGRFKAMVDNKTWGNADIVALQGGEAAIASKQDLTESIDYSLSDRSKLLPQAAHNNFFVPYCAASVIAWNTNKYNENTAPQSWQAFFDGDTPPKFTGPRGLLKNAPLTLEAAAMGAGIPREKLYPLDVAKAISALSRVKANLIWWDQGAQSVELLASRQVDFEFAWNGRIFNAAKGGQPLAYHLHDAILDGDGIVIPKGSPNAKWAQTFIAHMMEAKNQAEFSQLIPYGPTNVDAMELIPGKLHPFLPSSPENIKHTVFQDYDWWADNGPKALADFNDFLLG
jgi:putative spermidine/putrescine transport system substrate-binding protein